LVCRG